MFFLLLSGVTLLPLDGGVPLCGSFLVVGSRSLTGVIWVCSSSPKKGDNPEPLDSSRLFCRMIVVLSVASGLTTVGGDLSEGITVSSSSLFWSGYFKCAETSKNCEWVTHYNPEYLLHFLFYPFVANQHSTEDFTDLMTLKMNFQKPCHSSSQAQLVLGGKGGGEWVLFTIQTLLIWHFSSLQGTVTVLIVAKRVKPFLGLHVGYGDKAGHVLGTIFMGGVSEDGGGGVAGPAIPVGTESFRGLA